MIMQIAQLYGVVETDGDYGKVRSNQLIKSIQCFLSFGTGSINAQNSMIAENTTHTALTQETDIIAGMRLMINEAEYLINSVNPTGRFIVLYLQRQEGVYHGE